MRRWQTSLHSKGPWGYQGPLAFVLVYQINDSVQVLLIRVLAQSYLCLAPLTPDSEPGGTCAPLRSGYGGARSVASHSAFVPVFGLFVRYSVRSGAWSVGVEVNPYLFLRRVVVLISLVHRL